MNYIPALFPDGTESITAFSLGDLIKDSRLVRILKQHLGYNFRCLLVRLILLVV